MNDWPLLLGLGIIAVGIGLLLLYHGHVMFRRGYRMGYSAAYVKASRLIQDNKASNSWTG